ncbi:MAG: hypothetical protein IPI55_11335 [Flavobacteriales bacterium]|nr:hypothetical protein [Flavobacteriales bacterium]
MKKPIPSLAIAATMLISPIASAQVSFDGSPVGLSEYKSTLPAAPVHVMPAVDALTLMVEDAERLAAGSKRQRFGINHATDFTLDNSGVWSTLANGDRVWRLGSNAREPSASTSSSTPTWCRRVAKFSCTTLSGIRWVPSRQPVTPDTMFSA